MPNAYLQKASYKGVSFEVTSSSISAGRRVVLHEYPFRDEPFAEDLGRRARTISIEAFIFGSDARRQSERLIAAIEAKGQGTLVHPLYGSMVCIATDGTNVRTELCEDYVAVSFTLTEVGNLTFPSSASAADYLARLSADALQTFASDAISSALSSIPDGADLGQVYDGALTACAKCLSEIADSTYSKLWALQDSLGTLQNSASDLIYSTAAFTTQVGSVLGLAAKASTVTDWREVSYQAADLAMNSTLLPDAKQQAQAQAQILSLTRGRARAASAAASLSTTTIATKTTEARAQVVNAVRALFRQFLLAQSIGAATLVGTAQDRRDASATILTVAPRRDVTQVRAQVLKAIDAECELQTGQEILGLLYDARVRVWTDLSTRADPVRQVRTIELTHATPSLVAAYELYADASREAEIVDRNAIPNPLFCSGTLEVLAK